MIPILANLPEEFKSKVESLENDLDNEDDPLTLDRGRWIQNTRKDVRKIIVIQKTKILLS